MRRLLVLIVMCCSTIGVSAQMMALKTNMLMDAACIPNITMEIGTSSRTSLSLQGLYSGKTWYGGFTKYDVTRFVGMSPEFRYWFGGRTFDRFYLGAGLTGAHYRLMVEDNWRRGDALGGGPTMGYAISLKKHLILEFSAGLAAVHYWDNHKTKNVWNGNNIEHTNTMHGDYAEKGWIMMPYQLGVSLVYVIK